MSLRVIRMHAAVVVPTHSHVDYSGREGYFSSLSNAFFPFREILDLDPRESLPTRCRRKRNSLAPMRTFSFLSYPSSLPSTPLFQLSRNS